MTLQFWLCMNDLPDNDHHPVDKTMQTYVKMIKYGMHFHTNETSNQNITLKLKHTKFWISIIFYRGWMYTDFVNHRNTIFSFAKTIKKVVSIRKQCIYNIRKQQNKGSIDLIRLFHLFRLFHSIHFIISSLAIVTKEVIFSYEMKC